MTTPDAATLAQLEAARPDRSTWLAANAGSGKTRVLTDRVARLLLDGVSPQHILCLTYTKAAASEMQNRLFARLGEWAMRADEPLSDDLRKLGHTGVIDAPALLRARRLFAQAIETPGGLRIQTIHSFCASLLRRFPLEAGVTPQFTEMDDQTARLLRAEIVEEIATGPEAALFYDVARHYTGENLDSFTQQILRHQTAFMRGADRAALCKLFDQPAELTREDISAQVFLGDEQSLLRQLLPVLRASSSNDVKAAEKLAEIGALDFQALPILESVFLLKSGENANASKLPGVTKQPFPTRKLREDCPDLMTALDGWMTRVENLRESRIALLAIERSAALHRFAKAFIRVYSTAKQRRGLLDFDDLILRARDLLTDHAVAAWVLYRLDGGIDHILVDEAQDTSPAQWQVIERLAQEFTSGAGARANVQRTIFIVGDRKQSIYSFQGADPREFDRMQEDFASRLATTDTPLASRHLAYSFRSAPAILKTVDACFVGSEESGFQPDQSHLAFFDALPGRVDLWPVVEKPETEDPPPWHRPVDIRRESHPAVILAEAIAVHIQNLIRTRTPIPDPDMAGGARPLGAGDFLILVHRRSALFHEIIRACKAEGLAIAGADRLKVGGELAVRDLAALLSFLATQDDDLALATALRSPLFGWSEAELFTLAHGRGPRTLWEVLLERRDIHVKTVEILADLRAQVDFLRPFELIERILTRHDGRRQLLARLGAEAEDGIDALLSQALAYESRAVDSLTGFLVWMETDELEIKRQIDNAGDRIRVMTVHGAKGLEAPVVILPETGLWKPPAAPEIVAHEGVPLWRGAADAMPKVIAAAVEAGRAAQLAERDRLLYVAMTRAEKWLIVAAAGDLGKDGRCWHDRIRAAMGAAGAAPHDFPTGAGLRVATGDWPQSAPEPESGGNTPTLPLPSLFRTHAPAAIEAPAPLSPSDLGGPKSLPGERGLDETAAKRRGKQIHRLLEILPEIPRESWPQMAAQLLSSGLEAAAPEEIALLLTEARKVLDKPALAPLFNGEALAEVPVTATLAALDGARIHGVIDRLVLAPDHVLAVDFKTNAVLPERPEDCPDALLRQMGAYGQALSLIYPDRRIETAILWTRTATLMTLPHGLVTEALLRVGPLDAGGRAP